MSALLFPAVLIAFAHLADAPPDPATLPPPPEVLRPGLAAIDEAEMRFWVSFLASDELEGRNTAERGYDVAARFCATVLERFGARPAGDGGTFFQDFDVIRSEPDAEASGLTVKDAGGTDRFGLDEVALFSGDEIDWSIPWTFVGFGEASEGVPGNAYEGIPLAERIVLILPPPGRKEHETRAARAAGATRIAIISDERGKSRSGLRGWERPAFEPFHPEKAPVEIVAITRRVADRIFRPKGVTVEKLLAAGSPPSRLDLDGSELKLAVKRKETKLRGRNVVGLFDGADPALKGQAVVVSAHLDHVGQRGNEIFHGADDDASGSAGVLAMARALHASPRRPARSVLLVLFTGEERGFWGSRWFIEHPPVPTRSMVAEVQLDMIGRNQEHRDGKVRPEDNTNTVSVVGAKRKSLDLHRAILEGNRWIGLDLMGSGDEFFGGSDHVMFDEKGIPVAFFITGMHPDYHRPTDTADRINYPKMARICRLVFSLVYGVADRPDALKPVKRL